MASGSCSAGPMPRPGYRKRHNWTANPSRLTERRFARTSARSSALYGPFDTMELETFCDTEHGQSGGPLFAYWDGVPYIVGVLSGYQEEFTYSFPLSFSTSNTVFAGGPGAATTTTE